MKALLRRLFPSIYPHNLTTRFKLVHLRCSLSFKTQLIWEAYKLHMQLVYLLHRKNPDEAALIASHKFKKNGFAVLGKSKFNVSDLSKKVESIFQLQILSQYNLFPRCENQNITKWIYDILDEFSDHIQSIFKSYFQTYWISIYKTFPGHNPPDSSFAWHQDEDPRPLKKIFIYLNDVSKENGALRTFDKKQSYNLFKKGFMSNSPESRAMSQNLISKEIEKCSHWIEGEMGTVLIFDNNLIHRGTYPLQGYRTVIAIEIFPSKNKMTLQDVENSFVMPMANDWPENPYLWDRNK